MATNNDAESCGSGFQIQRMKVVKDVDGGAGGFDNGNGGQDVGPAGGVDIAADSNDRGDLAESVENFGTADVAGVDDEIGAAQGVESGIAKQAVSIGDQGDILRKWRHGVRVPRKAGFVCLLPWYHCTRK
jgi:hypothetical protein